jgi:hypothetical protein
MSFFINKALLIRLSVYSLLVIKLFVRLRTEVVERLTK